MTIANTTIQLKKSGVPGNVPTTLNYGELGINYADGKLYYKNALGAIASISTGTSTNSFSTIVSNGSILVATSNTDILSFNSTNGISISTNTTSKTITFDGSTILNLANGKTYTWYQNTVPLAANNTDLWVHTDTAKVYEYINGNTWIEFGPTPNAGNNTGLLFLTLNTFNGNGSNTTFTLTQTPVFANNVIASVDGIVQIQNSYSIINNTIVFSEPPYNGSTVEVRILSGTVQFTSDTIYANTIIFNGTNLQSVLNSQNTSINLASSLAQNAYNAANAAGSSTFVQAAFNEANLAYSLANSAYAAANAASSSAIIDINSTVITSNVIIGSNHNGLSVGPILINNGASVTISNGQRWVII